MPKKVLPDPHNTLNGNRTITEHDAIAQPSSQGPDMDIKECGALILQLLERINTLEGVVREQKSELARTQCAIAVNVIIEDAYTQTLINETNALQMRLKEHANAEKLNPLFSWLVEELHCYCNALIPLASGNYKPHNTANLRLEAAHGSTDLLEFILHHLPKISEVSNLAKTFASALPIVGLAIKGFEVLYDHHVIHHAQHVLGSINRYSDKQRDALYRNVIARTLLMLATRLDALPSHNTLAQRALSDKAMLHHLYALILANTITGLAKVHESSDIDQLAHHWSDAIIRIFHPQGVTMPVTTQTLQQYIYPKEALSVALKVQSIFTNLDYNSSAEFLSVPEITDFVDDFHRKLYQLVLAPYQNRVETLGFFSFFAGYSGDEIKVLRHYQGRFNHALVLINQELAPLKAKYDPTFALQLNLINTCLYAQLQVLCQAMPWHKAGGRLFIDTASPLLSCVKEPLQLTDDEKQLVVMTLEGKAASERANAEKSLREAADQKAIAAEFRAELAESRLENQKDKKAVVHEQEKTAQAEEKTAQAEEKTARAEEKAARAEEQLFQFRGELEQAKALLLKTMEAMKANRPASEGLLTNGVFANRSTYAGAARKAMDESSHAGPSGHSSLN